MSDDHDYEEHILKQTHIVCPHCGHHTHVDLDCSAGDQDYIDECSNCYAPIHLNLHLNEISRKVELNISSDNEQFY